MRSEGDAGGDTAEALGNGAQVGVGTDYGATGLLQLFKGLHEWWQLRKARKRLSKTAVRDANYLNPPSQNETILDAHRRIRADKRVSREKHLEVRSRLLLPSIVTGIAGIIEGVFAIATAMGKTFGTLSKAGMEVVGKVLGGFAAGVSAVANLGMAVYYLLRRRRRGCEIHMLENEKELADAIKAKRERCDQLDPDSEALRQAECRLAVLESLQNDPMLRQHRIKELKLERRRQLMQIITYAVGAVISTMVFVAILCTTPFSMPAVILAGVGAALFLATWGVIRLATRWYVKPQERRVQNSLNDLKKQDLRERRRAGLGVPNDGVINLVAHGGAESSQSSSSHSEDAEDEVDVESLFASDGERLNKEWTVVELSSSH